MSSRYLTIEHAGDEFEVVLHLRIAGRICAIARAETFLEAAEIAEREVRNGNASQVVDKTGGACVSR